MSGFWNACYDMLMSSGQRRQRERARSRRAFQVCDLPWGPGAAPHLGPLWTQRTAAGTERRERSWKHPAGLTCSSTPTPQELVLDPVQRRARFEGLRYAAALKQQAAQHSTALLHWGALWRQLASPCGAWALRWAGLWEESRRVGGSWEGGARRVSLRRSLGGRQRGLQPAASHS